MRDNFGHLIFSHCRVAYYDTISRRMKEGLVTFIDDDKIYIDSKFIISAMEVVVLDKKYVFRE